MKNYFLLLFTITLLGLYSCESTLEEDTAEITTEENIDLRGHNIYAESITVEHCCGDTAIEREGAPEIEVLDHERNEKKVLLAPNPIPVPYFPIGNQRRVTIVLESLTHGFYNVTHGGPLTYTFSIGSYSVIRKSSEANPTFCIPACKDYTLVISAGSSQSPSYSFNVPCC